MLTSPTFRDLTDYFDQNIDTEFTALNEGLKVIRSKLGEERYAELAAMSDRMRVLFEADPEDTNGDAEKGREFIDQMQTALKRSGRKAK